MMPKEELYYHFPCVLKEKLLKKELEFPAGTLFSYEKIYAYRVIEREADDFAPITINDFQSYFQLHKLPKPARGRTVTYEDMYKVPAYYGVSSFLTREVAEQTMHLPNPKKKIAGGYIYDEGGPELTTEKNGHITWWLYENANVTNFKIL